MEDRAGGYSDLHCFRVLFIARSQRIRKHSPQNPLILTENRYTLPGLTLSSRLAHVGLDVFAAEGGRREAHVGRVASPRTFQTVLIIALPLRNSTWPARNEARETVCNT